MFSTSNYHVYLHPLGADVDEGEGISITRRTAVDTATVVGQPHHVDTPVPGRDAERCVSAGRRLQRR